MKRMLAVAAMCVLFSACSVVSGGLKVTDKGGLDVALKVQPPGVETPLADVSGSVDLLGSLNTVYELLKAKLFGSEGE